MEVRDVGVSVSAVGGTRFGEVNSDLVHSRLAQERGHGRDAALLKALVHEGVNDGVVEGVGETDGLNHGHEHVQGHLIGLLLQIV